MRVASCQYIHKSIVSHCNRERGQNVLQQSQHRENVKVGVGFCTQTLSTPETSGPNHHTTQFENSDEPSDQATTQLSTITKARD
jgi:hypothetical protein